MNEKQSACDICGGGPFSVVELHKRRQHPEWVPDHGTMTRYTARGCRCDVCKVAMQAYVRMRRRQPLVECPDCEFRSTDQGVAKHRSRVHGPVHGTGAAYKTGCRCQPCREAWVREERGRRQRRGELRVGTHNCSICGATGLVNLQMHERLVHGLIVELAHGSTSMYAKGCRCDECRSASSQARTDARHEALRRSGQPVFACRDCGRVFRSEVHWATHESRQHGIPHLRPARPNAITRRERPFFCAACGHSFSSSAAQRKHESTFHGITYWGRYVWRKNRASLVRFTQPRRRPEREFCLHRSASNGGHRHLSVCAENVDDAVKKLLTAHGPEDLIAAIARTLR